MFIFHLGLKTKLPNLNQNYDKQISPKTSDQHH